MYYAFGSLSFCSVNSGDLIRYCTRVQLHQMGGFELTYCVCNMGHEFMYPI
jgi:hypothetical protein